MSEKGVPVQIPPYFRESESFDVRSLETPYHIADIQMPKHWATTGAGEGIKVGVCDTGVDSRHPEFEDRIDATYFFTGRSADDQNDHGTHVSSTILGATVGVAPKARLVMAKVLGANGSGNSRDVGLGIDKLAEDGCHIISLSLGGSRDDPYSRDAVNAAIAAGIIVVAATGNEGASHVGYPARHCIGIGAVDRGLKLAYFSNRGKNVDLVGYGVNVYAGVPGGKYARFSGTSMATPFIAGLIANRLSAEKKHLGKIVTKSDEDMLKLETFVTDLGPEGRDTSYGRGFPDVNKAFYERLTPDGDTNAPPSEVPISIPCDGSYVLNFDMSGKAVATLKPSGG